MKNFIFFGLPYPRLDGKLGPSRTGDSHDLARFSEAGEGLRSDHGTLARFIPTLRVSESLGFPNRLQNDSR